MSYRAGIGPKWKPLIFTFQISCIFPISFNNCQIVCTFLRHFDHFCHFWAIFSPSSANNSRTNWATELGLVPNERPSFVEFGSAIGFYFHWEITELWPFFAAMYPLLPLVLYHAKDLDLAHHKIAQNITKIVFTASQDDKVKKSLVIWMVAQNLLWAPTLTVHGLIISEARL